MRLFAIIVVLALSACATRPDDGRYYYRGIYAPGGVEIGENGAFAARTTVWNAGHAPIAGEAAYFRLEEAARTHGYTHAVIEQVVQTTLIGHQYVVSGMLYSQYNEAAGAVAIGDLRHPGGEESRTVSQPVIAARAATPPQRTVRTTPRPAAPVETVGDPLVIQAPDFISELENDAPTG